MGCTSSNLEVIHHNHKRTIILCGTKVSGKSTIYQHIRWKNRHQQALNDDGTITDSFIAVDALVYILNGLVQLCKDIMDSNDPSFTKFQSIMTTSTDILSPLYQAYKAVIEFYYNYISIKE